MREDDFNIPPPAPDKSELKPASLDDEQPEQTTSNKLGNEKLKREVQRRRHRLFLFLLLFTTIISSYAVFLTIIYKMYIGDSTKLLSEKPYLLIPASLLGVLPTALLLAMLKGLYRNEESTTIDKDSLDIFKQGVDIVKNTILIKKGM